MEQTIIDARGDPRVEARILVLAEMGGNLSVIKTLQGLDYEGLVAGLEE